MNFRGSLCSVLCSSVIICFLISNAASQNSASNSTSAQLNPVNASTKPTQSFSTTARPTLSMSEVLSPFWCSLDLKVSSSVDVNSTTFKNRIEDNLAKAYNDALVIHNQKQQAGKRRRKRAATQGNVQLQLVSLVRSGNTDKVTATFFVQQDGKFVPASNVVQVMGQLSIQELSLKLGVPVTSSVTAFDATQTPAADTRTWIVGAVLGTLGAIVLIVWLVLFVYAHCLRPQPPPLLDTEAGGEVEFKSPIENGVMGGHIVYGESGIDGDKAAPAPMRHVRPEVRVDDEQVNNLDITLLADEVARRLDKKVSKIVDRKLDARTESMRDEKESRRTVLLSPSEEDSFAEEASRSGRPPKHCRRRKSKINSISPSEDDSLHLPPLRRPERSDYLSEEEEERRRRRRARQRVARDLDRALGEEAAPEERKKGKSKRRQRSREADGKDETLKEARNKMSELLSEPYPVTGSSGEATIDAQAADTVDSAPPDLDGELLEPAAAQPEPGHRPIRVLTSLRPEALHTASLSSAYRAADEVERIRPAAEQDLRSHPNVTLDVRGETPVYVRSPGPPSDSRATPVSAFRPVAAPQTTGHPGAPLPDETDVAAASPKPLIDSIREELQRLSAKSDA